MVEGAALIAESAPESRRRLAALLGTHSRLELLGQCCTGPAAVTAIRRHHPDVAFLAADLPELDAVAVLERVRDDPPRSVVVLCEPDHELVVALRSSGIHHLPCPVEAQSLARVIAHVKTDLCSGEAMDGRIARLLEAVGYQPRAVSRLAVRSAGVIALLGVDEIDWIESAGNYIRIHTSEQVHQMRGTLSGLEERLDSRRFLRIHRTIIVNVDRIRQITPHCYGDAAVVLRDGTRLNLSRGYRRSVDRFLERYTA